MNFFSKIARTECNPIKLEFFLAVRVSTTVWIHYPDSNETPSEKAWWEMT